MCQPTSPAGTQIAGLPWLGSLATAKEAALTYDIAARKLYGPLAELNLLPQEYAGFDSVPTSQPPETTPTSTTTMRDVEVPKQLEAPQAQSHSQMVDITGHHSRAIAEAAVATLSLESQPTRVSSLPEFHQLQYYSAAGRRASHSSSGEHLKDIQMFGSDDPTPSPSVDDDNDSNSSLSASMDNSAAVAGMQLGNQESDKLSPTSGHIEKPPRKPRKRWKKGSMKGKGGPQNAACDYRGVRQRTWGKWVAEIREPKKRARLWLGSFATAKEAALAYDIAARKLYGPLAELNLPPHESAGFDSVPTSQPPETTPTSTTTMRDVEVPKQLEAPQAQSHSQMVDNPSHHSDAIAEAAVATLSSESQPTRVSSLPEFHQLQYYSAAGRRASHSSSGEHLKDIQMFLDQVDSHYPPPSPSVDDDNDSNSSMDMDSVAAAVGAFTSASAFVSGTFHHLG